MRKGAIPMKVLLFQGKVFYPLLCSPGVTGELERHTLVNQKGRTVNIFRKEAFSVEEMRPGLGALLSGGEGSVASIYYFNRREAVDLPREGQKVLLYTRGGSQIPLTLGRVGFVVFQTGVCFLEMDVSLEEQALETVMEAAYYLCEVKDRNNALSYEEVTFDAAAKTKRTDRKTVSIKDLFLDCIRFLGPCGHFEDKPLEAMTAKPLLYSYYFLESAPENPGALAENIAQNYKLSYKGLEDGKHSLRTFQNSTWCVSANGAGNLSWQVEDPAANDFFRTTFVHKWRSEYLFLFLNVIHQKYAVLKSLGEFAESVSLEQSYDALKQELLISEVMQERCERLKMRCFFDMPSRVDHVNRVYRFFQQSMEVPRYLAGLNRKLQESVNVCKSYTGRIKEIDDLQRDIHSAQTEIKIALLTACVTCLTFFNSFYATLLHLFRGEFGEIGVDAIILTATFLATILGVILNVANKRDTIQELRRKIARAQKKLY